MLNPSLAIFETVGASRINLPVLPPLLTEEAG